MPDTEESEQDRDTELLRKHCALLSEHFDSVQIFVTRTENDGTRSVHHGAGNWYARYGHVQEWLRKENEYIRRETR